MLIDPDTTLAGRAPGLPDDAFEHDGLVTKRHVRASAMAYLRPLPGQLIWDIGAGAGSVVIEWCRMDPANRGLAVERKGERAQRCRRNLANLTMPGQVELVDGVAADVVAQWRADGIRPDAVFIGGGGSRDVIDACYEALVDGGRMVVHGVTVETEQTVLDAQETYGGEVSRISVEQGDKIGRLRGWAPLRTIVTWAVTKH